MDLGAIQTGIETWLGLTALDASEQPLNVVFPEEAYKPQTKAHVRVVPGPVVKIGHDVPRYTYDDLTDEYVQKMWGTRELTMRFAFVTYNQSWGKNARQFAEQWRIRAESDRSTETLGAIPLELVDIGELVPADVVAAQRLTSQIVASARFRLWAYEIGAGVDAGYIRRVSLTGEGYVLDEFGKVVTDADGNPVVHEDTLEIDVSIDQEPVSYG